MLILHEKIVDIFQDSSEKTSIPFEINLTASEQCGDRNCFHFCPFAFRNEIGPKFVFHEKGKARLGLFEKGSGIALCVKWKIDCKINRVFSFMIMRM